MAYDAADPGGLAMSSGLFLVLAIGLGMVAGLRSMTAPAVVAWAAHMHWLDLDQSIFSFLNSTPALAIVSILAVGELVMDKLPFTPSRKSLIPFSGRILAGAFSGAALGLGRGHTMVLGAIAGAVGAVGGTLGGYRARTGLVKTLRVSDIVIALLEDVVAICAALAIVMCH